MQEFKNKDDTEILIVRNLRYIFQFSHALFSPTVKLFLFPKENIHTTWRHSFVCLYARSQGSGLGLRWWEEMGGGWILHASFLFILSSFLLFHLMFVPKKPAIFVWVLRILYFAGGGGLVRQWCAKLSDPNPVTRAEAIT